MKRFLSFFLAFVMVLSVSTAAFAEVPTDVESAEEESIVKPSDPTRAEETVWYFRTYHGVRQMRLWSLTYGHWLTDWIDIGPAN